MWLVSIQKRIAITIFLLIILAPPIFNNHHHFDYTRF
jgi:hypothetical protein